MRRRQRGDGGGAWDALGTAGKGNADGIRLQWVAAVRRGRPFLPSRDAFGYIKLLQAQLRRDMFGSFFSFFDS
jgi:hypothetical protein